MNNKIVTVAGLTAIIFVFLIFVSFSAFSNVAIVENHSEIDSSYSAYSLGSDYKDDLNMLVYFPFDSLNVKDGETLTKDYSEFHRSAVVENAVLVQGRKGNALRFDGDADAVLNYFDGDNLDDFTVSAWVKADKLPNKMASDFPGIVSNEDYSGNSGFYFGVYRRKGSQVGLRLNGASEYELSSVFDSSGRWVHLAEVYDGDRLWLYKNGNLVDVKKVGTFSIKDSGEVLRIGNGWEGSIDELRIYNRALTSQEISLLFLVFFNLDL